MSFAARETSIRAGQPIELFDFRRGPVHWRYTGADRDIVQAGIAYSAGAWSTQGFTASGDPTQETLTVSGPLSAGIAEPFAALSPSDPVYLTIYHLHAGDTDAAAWWVGQVTSSLRKPDHIEFSGESVVTAQSAQGLRMGWQKSCPHAIYDAGCGLDPAAFSFAAIVTGVSGNTVTAASFADPSKTPPGRLAGGFLSFAVDGGLLERRAIVAHAGDTVTLLGTTQGIGVGAMVTASLGCDQTLATCHDVFNNLPNYGGVPGLPAVSPFEQSPFI